MANIGRALIFGVGTIVAFAIAIGLCVLPHFLGAPDPISAVLGLILAAGFAGGLGAFLGGLG
jgi:predicted cobalt transporter CbtA